MKRIFGLSILGILTAVLLISVTALAQDTQQQDEAQAKSELDAKQKKKKDKDLQKELLPVYKEWLNGPVSTSSPPKSAAPSSTWKQTKSGRTSSRTSGSAGIRIRAHLRTATKRNTIAALRTAMSTIPRESPDGRPTAAGYT